MSLSMKMGKIGKFFKEFFRFIADVLQPFKCRSLSINTIFYKITVLYTLWQFDRKIHEKYQMPSYENHVTY